MVIVFNGKAWNKMEASGDTSTTENTDKAYRVEVLLNRSVV